MKGVDLEGVYMAGVDIARVDMVGDIKELGYQV